MPQITRSNCAYHAHVFITSQIFLLSSIHRFHRQLPADAEAEAWSKLPNTSSWMLLSACSYGPSSIVPAALRHACVKCQAAPERPPAPARHQTGARFVPGSFQRRTPRSRLSFLNARLPCALLLSSIANRFANYANGLEIFS
jgi:hypothetical protein